jgi:hypothetical protein
MTENQQLHVPPRVRVGASQGPGSRHAGDMPTVGQGEHIARCLLADRPTAGGYAADVEAGVGLREPPDTEPRAANRAWLRAERTTRVLVTVQFVLIVAAAVAVATRLPIWSFADEREHAAYVDSVGRGHLPLPGRDKVPEQLAVVGGSRDGMSYESVQPPLYYVVAALPWDLAKAVGGVTFAARTLRVVDVLGLCATVALLWALARRIVDRRGQALVAFSVALLFVAWPGVVFRS